MVILEIVEKVGGEYFVSYLDAETGVQIIRGWTTQPRNWLEWAAQAVYNYSRMLRKHDIGPEDAAQAARATRMARGVPSVPFSKRYEMYRLMRAQ
jgi:hypothetical protein